MSSQRYPEEFKTEAVKQILDHGHSVADVSNRLGVSTHSCTNGCVNAKCRWQHAPNN